MKRLVRWQVRHPLAPARSVENTVFQKYKISLLDHNLSPVVRRGFATRSPWGRATRHFGFVESRTGGEPDSLV
jgi:hypothetical protein